MGTIEEEEREKRNLKKKRKKLKKQKIKIQFFKSVSRERVFTISTPFYHDFYENFYSTRVGFEIDALMANSGKLIELFFGNFRGGDSDRFMENSICLRGQLEKTKIWKVLSWKFS